MNKYQCLTTLDRSWYVEGPGMVMWRYGSSLHSETLFNSVVDASKAKLIAELAYAEGYKHAQSDIRKSLGL